VSSVVWDEQQQGPGPLDDRAPRSSASSCRAFAPPGPLGRARGERVRSLLRRFSYALRPAREGWLPDAELRGQRDLEDRPVLAKLLQEVHSLQNSAAITPWLVEHDVPATDDHSEEKM
jgi:hypothetical protein